MEAPPGGVAEVLDSQPRETFSPSCYKVEASETNRNKARLTRRVGARARLPQALSRPDLFGDSSAAPGPHAPAHKDHVLQHAAHFYSALAGCTVCRGSKVWDNLTANTCRHGGHVALSLTESNTL